MFTMRSLGQCVMLTASVCDLRQEVQGMTHKIVRCHLPIGERVDAPDNRPLWERFSVFIRRKRAFTRVQAMRQILERERVSVAECFERMTHAQCLIESNIGVNHFFYGFDRVLMTRFVKEIII